MPGRGRREPAVHLAGPGCLRELFPETCGAVAGRGQGNEIEILKHTAAPPGDERRILAAARAGINPRAVLFDDRGLQLVECRDFDPVGEITLPFELTEEFLDRLALGEND